MKWLLTLLLGATAAVEAAGPDGARLDFASGAGASPVIPATNTVGGNGGVLGFASGSGGSPQAGMFRKGGNGGPINVDPGPGGQGVNASGGHGGAFNIDSGNGGSATGGGNGGNGGGIQLNAGAAGSSIGGGVPGAPGIVNITGGNGGSGITNNDGGPVYIQGGIPQAGAQFGPLLFQSLGGNVGIGIETPMATLHIHVVGTGEVLAMSGIINAAPADSTTVAAWIPIMLNGTNGFIPFYK